MSRSSRFASVIDLHIVSCHSIQDARVCVELQRAIWGYTDVESVPARTLAVAIKIGGHVLVARDGALPIGFALAFPGRINGVDHLHSNMVGVLPAYQGCGVGFKLKAKQRKIALSQGLESIGWTFDPLSLRNAYFNLVRLGAIVRRIHANLYGVSKSPLHAGLPTDRFVAEWQLSSPRVAGCMQGIPATTNSPQPVRVSLPSAIDSIRRSEPSRAIAIQAELRSELQWRFTEGYAITGFAVEQAESAFLLEPYAE